MTCTARSGDSPSTVAKIRTVVILAGGVGRRADSPGNGKGVLALPVEPEADVLDVWLRALGELADRAGRPALDVRIAIDRKTVAPDLDGRRYSERLRVSVEKDDAEYRGTAGTLRDVTEDLAADDLVLVAVASQLPRGPLLEALASLGVTEEGVCVSHSGRSDLASLLLLRRGRLHDVPSVGFFDLKEQLRIASHEDAHVKVTRLPDGVFLPIRTRREYLTAVRSIAGRSSAGTNGVASPFAERWGSSFRLVASGATVHPSASLQDSVVLEGATVEAGAHVVRSVVCSGATVRAGAVVVNSVVTASGTHEL